MPELTVRFLGDTSDLMNKIQGVSETVASIGGKLSKVGEGLTAALTVPIAGLSAAAVASFNAIDEAMDTIRVGTGATGEQLQQLGEVMKRVGAESPASFKDIGVVISELNTRFGLTGEALEGVTKQIVEMARITGTDVTSAVQGASHVFAIWNIETENMQSVLDHLFKVSQSTGISISALNDALQNTAPVFKEMGLNVEQAATLLGMLEKNGVDVTAMSRALTSAMNDYMQNVKLARDGTDSFDKSLQSAMKVLENSKATTEQKEKAIAKLKEKFEELRPVLEAVGIDVNKLDAFQKELSSETVNTQQVFGKWKDIMTEFKTNSYNAADYVRSAFEQLKNGTMDLDQAIDIFGAKAGTKLYELAKQGKLNFEEFNAVIKNNSETILKAAEDTKDFGERLTELKNRLTIALEPLGNALAKAFENFMPVLEKLLSGLSALVNWFVSLPAPIQQVAIAIGALLAGLGPAMMLFGKLSEVFSSSISAMQQLIGLAPQLSNGFSQALSLIANNPAWVAWAAVITGIIVLIVAIIKNWDEVVKFFQSTWNALQSGFQAFGNFLVNVFSGVFEFFKSIFLGWLEFVQGNLQLIVTFFTNAFDSIKTVFTVIFDALKPVFSAVIEFFKTVLNEYFKFWMNTWISMRDFLNKTLEAIFTFFRSIFVQIRDFTQMIIDSIRKFVDVFVKWLTDTFNAFRTFITTLLNGLFEFVKGLFDKVIKATLELLKNLKDMFTKTFESIKAIVAGAVTVIKNVFDTVIKWLMEAWNKFKAFWIELWTGVKNVFVSVWQSIVSFFTSVYNTLMSMIRALFDWVLMVINKIKEMFSLAGKSQATTKSSSTNVTLNNPTFVVNSPNDVARVITSTTSSNAAR